MAYIYLQHNFVGRVAFSRREAVVGGTLGRGDFGFPPVLTERAAVVAEADVLRSAVKGFAEHVEEYVAVLRSTSRAADVGLRKSAHGLRHGCPTGIVIYSAVGRRLAHSVGAACAYKHSAEPLTAYARVNVVGHAALCEQPYACQKQRGKYGSSYFHTGKQIVPYPTMCESVG